MSDPMVYQDKNSTAAGIELITIALGKKEPKRNIAKNNMMYDMRTKSRRH